MSEILNPRKLYRLPWSYSDNIITWLEPTKSCNIYCEGCYSANRPNSHKTLEQIKSDLDVFAKHRISHSVSIAGGEPLVHPQIEEVVRMVAERGYKPIVNTNGAAMTEEKMRALKAAGMKGMTFHIDSFQQRPGWEGKNELELNALRQHFAEMAARVGGLSCAFNATVYGHTLKYVPEVLKWGQQHIDKVNVMVFIMFRAAQSDNFDYYAHGKKVEMKALVYGADKGMKVDLKAQNVVDEIRKEYPDFQPAAYLGGTEDPSAMKWLMTLRVGNKNRIFGYLGPKFMELAQTWHHMLHGKYLGYVHPNVMARVKWMFPLAILDSGLAKAFRKWLWAAIKNPLLFFTPVRMQSVMLIQPVDIHADGRQSMCDGCPDMTAHDGRLVWSCRLEEPLKYGCFLTMVPRKAQEQAAEA
ncbi:MAG: radical SAM protein, partial [Elusimicrobia bacterium]|nr:radical SAM protein [Elusimicrobiota bacterium]